MLSIGSVLHMTKMKEQLLSRQNQHQQHQQIIQLNLQILRIQAQTLHTNLQINNTKEAYIQNKIQSTL
jgi:hypothetical protein